MTEKEAFRLIYQITHPRGRIKRSYEPNQFESALETALCALEKQIPKKPLIWQGIKTPESPIPFDDWGYECPCCGNQEIDYPDHHCECGQALDWREEND